MIIYTISQTTSVPLMQVLKNYFSDFILLTHNKTWYACDTKNYKQRKVPNFESIVHK
jgi:hypothetical protein